MFSSTDYGYMAQALRLAEKGLYSTSPNPRVGCVLVRSDQVVGSGWHERSGEPHAEINALAEAGAAARGATAYLTLEPCSHHGRTPPCADALIKAGIARLVTAMQDPNPLVSGRGCALLQNAGIEVQTGLMGAEAKALNIGFITRMTHGRPWVRMKIAASLDGKTALNNGVSQWITSEAARRDGHRFRARSCAVMTGIGTVLADDPQLTVRHMETYRENVRQPLRVVVDSRLEIPVDASLLRGDGELIFTTTAGEGKILALHDMGARVIVLPDENNGVDLAAMMQRLADFEINELLVEAGCKLNGSLILAGLVDELVVYLAPYLIGDMARGMLKLPELSDLAQKRALKIHDLRTIGPDIRIISRFS
ncbi:bifunctional diaminohydroxyphosphoribosylaminopyrimidine deaminase/5-amino-6-(5-phosphoribosylamino)uracil reductase RibD [Nitrosovibrio sp. Nv6]|uniref:bifunctional diaminohydroxyphosphoribosylaminopyrimidine deaminase/5-amino-6-(5-phosphoribosylamino)uracil reductase RibD n=1 Tax=Nitrosovibrio sp. Nv6 TaxID=1855340 RepID=UPI0008D258C3|nr:bifunctional diaminohydroxyphosphoribosylaminopyrimidine deaminase/5-amino-6-(5-phosphoribosylamino)uracil reductase RibD [Nitrosovibrio sp. Nv6]SEP38014.1 diaminohydroxyphosphoribosylaminopyrimidine deaminase / 5-amino-6-(5-phosphoribosylamino)uracil reductase [Nitrosovibrio sp. Nv6]